MYSQNAIGNNSSDYTWQNKKCAVRPKKPTEIEVQESKLYIYKLW